MIGELKSKLIDLSSSIRTKFSLFRGSGVYTYSGRRIISNMVRNILNEANFDNMNRNDIYENIYMTEPSVGGAIDRFSSLCAMAYQGLYIRVGEELDSDERRLLEIANEVERKLDVRKKIEAWAELLLIHGNVFIDKETLFVYPNRYVSIIDENDGYSTAIINPKYFVFNEDQQNELQKIVKPYEDIYHIKYKDTKVFVYDHKNRLTYGIYSISPLDRLIYTIQWKRQIMACDMQVRWRSIPREHHIINSKAFSLQNYTGTRAERITKAKNDLENELTNYATKIKTQEPDEGYITTDTVEIRQIEPRFNYTMPNDLIDQLTENVWVALNTPESIVSGSARGSYASELIISGYVASKVIRLTEIICDVLLDIIRNKVKEIDDGLPVDKLKIKVALDLEASRLERFRQASVMAQMGIFTADEIRMFLGFEPKGDLSVVNVQGRETINDQARYLRQGQTEPTTPHSDEKQRREHG